MALCKDRRLVTHLLDGHLLERVQCTVMYAANVLGKRRPALIHVPQVQELNRKPKNWKDLLTDEPFTQKDIIHIQDPMNLQVWMALHLWLSPAHLLVRKGRFIPYAGPGYKKRQC